MLKSAAVLLKQLEFQEGFTEIYCVPINGMRQFLKRSLSNA